MAAPTIKEPTDSDAGDATKWGAPDAVHTAKILKGTHATEEIQATAIADGTVTNSEFQFINTLTSNAQDQLNLKPETDSLQRSELVYTNGSTQNIHNLQSNSLVTFGGNQYIAFYDAVGQIVLQKKSGTTRELLEQNILTTKTSDLGDNHDHIALGIDETGIIHISYDQHSGALKYFRMPTASSVLGTAGSDISMVGTNESSVTYPVFFNDTADKLFFMFRDGISGDGDEYLYEYASGTTTWAAATGTSTAGLLVDGKTASPDVNAYLSRPFVDSSNIAHFTGVWRETSDADTNKDPFYFAYNITTGAVTQADGTSQTVPITPTNDDTIVSSGINTNVSGQLQVRSVYKDSAGTLHVMNQYDDSNSVQQIFHGVHTGSGSWTNTQVTYRPETPDNNNTVTPILVDSTTEYFYVFYWNAIENYTFQVIESRDLGVTWSESYPIGEPNYQRAAFNVDYNLWDSSKIFHRLIQYIPNENSSSGSGSAFVGKERSVYLDQWNPSQAKTKTLSNINSIMAHDDIRIISEKGIIEMGTFANDAASDVVIKTGLGQGTFSSARGFSVIDQHGAEVRLTPDISGSPTATSAPALTMKPFSSTRSAAVLGIITAADDTGTVACIEVSARREDNSAIITRPIMMVKNLGSVLFQIGVSGAFDFKSGVVSNFVFDEDGTGNAITNLADASIKAGAAIAYSKLSLTGAILNADLAGSIANTKLATDPLARANHTGTQLASTISDFASATTTRTNISIDQDGTGNAITNLANASIKAAAGIVTSKLADSSNFVLKNTAQTYDDGIKLTFNPNGTNAGINVGVHTAAPSSPVAGDVYLNSTTNKLEGYINGAWVDLGQSGSEVATWTQDHSSGGFSLSTIKDITHTGRHKLDKGADVASGTELTLGADGNVFDITGTTTVNTILATSWQAGSIVTLQFDGILTVTHNSGGTNDILLGDQSNMTTAAGDVLTLFFNGTDWVEKSRSVVGSSGGGGFTFIEKTGDQTVNNSTTLVNVTDFTFAADANSRYLVMYTAMFHSGATPDIKFGITVPTSSTGFWGQHDNGVTLAALSGIVILSGVGAGAERPALMFASVDTVGTAGNITLQFAQNTADVSDTVVVKESNMWYVKVA